MNGFSWRFAQLFRTGKVRTNFVGVKIWCLVTVFWHIYKCSATVSFTVLLLYCYSELEFVCHSLRNAVKQSKQTYHWWLVPTEALWWYLCIIAMLCFSFSVTAWSHSMVPLRHLPAIIISHLYKRQTVSAIYLFCYASLLFTCACVHMRVEIECNLFWHCGYS